MCPEPCRASPPAPRSLPRALSAGPSPSAGDHRGRACAAPRRRTAPHGSPAPIPTAAGRCCWSGARAGPTRIGFLALPAVTVSTPQAVAVETAWPLEDYVALLREE